MKFIILIFSHLYARILPDYNYSISIKTNNGAQDLIHFLMIDTVILCGNTDEATYGQPKFSSKQEEISSIVYFKHLENKIRTISNTSAPYFIVSGHFPVWSIAEHGPTKCLVDRFLEQQINSVQSRTSTNNMKPEYSMY